MKKILSALLAALLLMMGGGLTGFAEEEAPVEIWDREGLQAVARRPEGSYRLMADIDMGGEDWVPIPFYGSFDGNGHGLYNLRVRQTGAERRVTRDGNLKRYDTGFAGLFSELVGAEVRDLSLIGVLVEIEAQEHCFAAALAGYADHAVIRGCRVEGRVHMVNYSVMVGVGGLVGFGCGSAADCACEVELVFEDRNLQHRCEEFMGGILACGVMDIDRCTVAIDGYDSCRGYVHNGGLVGMFYLCGLDFYPSSMCDNTVSGQIRFFEDNPDRRAYCAPFRGETLTNFRYNEGNSSDFKRMESFQYDTLILPESCEAPVYTDTVTAPGCDSWGFTTHSCQSCGYAWRDSYTPPEHRAGEWELSRAPGYESEGTEQRRCSVCGTLLAERSVPALIPAAAVVLDDGGSLRLRYGESRRLTAHVLPEDASDSGLLWSSSDPAVVTVEPDGTLRAVGRGEARVTAQSADGFAEAVCDVTVRYTLGQWLRSLVKNREP